MLVKEKKNQKTLKENKNNKEVKKYINALVREKNSPYFEYCINKYYFSKDAKDLSLAESAFVAGITHGPNGYNPFGEEDRSEKIKNRRLYVLQDLLKLRYDIYRRNYQNLCQKCKTTTYQSSCNPSPRCRKGGYNREISQ